MSFFDSFDTQQNRQQNQSSYQNNNINVQQNPSNSYQNNSNYTQNDYLIDNFENNHNNIPPPINRNSQPLSKIKCSKCKALVDIESIDSHVCPKEE